MPDFQKVSDGKGNFGKAHTTLVSELNEQLVKADSKIKLPSNMFTAGYTMQEMSRMLKASIKSLNEEQSLSEAVILQSSAGLTAKVLTTIWDAAYETNIGRQLVTVISQDNPTVKIPKEGRAEWIEVSKGGGDGPQTKADYSFTEWSAKKYQAVVKVEQDMIDDALWAVIQRQLAALGNSFGEFETNLIVDTLYAGKGQDVTGAGTLTMAKVIEAWRKFQRYPGGGMRTPSHLVLSPEHFENLTTDAAFQNILYHRADLASNKIQGAVGFIPGNIEVLVHPALAANTSMMIQKSLAGVHLIRQDLNLEEIDDPLADLVRAKGSFRGYPKVTEANCIVGIHA